MIILPKRRPFKLSRAISKQIWMVVASPTVSRQLLSANLLGKIARKAPLLRKVISWTRKDFTLVHKNLCRPEGEKKWKSIRCIVYKRKINLFGNDAERILLRAKAKEFHIHIQFGENVDPDMYLGCRWMVKSLSRTQSY